MPIWIRQIATVTNDIDTVEAQFKAALDEDVVHRHPAGMEPLGLVNGVIAIGDELFESVMRVREKTVLDSYYERQGGDCGYMLTLQTDEFEKFRDRVDELGIRVVHRVGREDFLEVQTHPADTKGTYLDICQQNGTPEELADGIWWPAGYEDWKAIRSQTRVSGIVGAEIETKAPEEIATLWSSILQIPVSRGTNGEPLIELHNSYLRFIPSPEGRPDKMSAMDVKAVDRDAIMEAAKANDIPNNGVDQIIISGLKINLV